jgi:cytoskeletal protein RodZ
LCNSNTYTYGNRGEKLQSQIQKLVYRWILLFRANTYSSKVLNALNVKSFATIQEELTKRSSAATTNPKIASDLSSSGSSDSTSSNKSVEVKKRDNKIKKKPATKPAPCQESAKAKSAPCPPTAPSLPTTAKMSSKSPNRPLPTNTGK